MRNTFPHIFGPHLKSGFLVVFRIWRSTVSVFLEWFIDIRIHWIARLMADWLILNNLFTLNVSCECSQNRSCFAPFSRRFASTRIVFISFSPVHTKTPYPFENAFIPSVPTLKWTRRMRISTYRPGKLAQFWILTVKRAGARSCLFGWRHGFQIALFSPFTLENSVFKKHRFQIAPLWRAFSNDSVFGDCFRRCSVDDPEQNISVFVWKRISVDGSDLKTMLFEIAAF